MHHEDRPSLAEDVAACANDQLVSRHCSLRRQNTHQSRCFSAGRRDYCPKYDLQSCPGFLAMSSGRFLYYHYQMSAISTISGNVIYTSNISRRGKRVGGLENLESDQPMCEMLISFLKSTIVKRSETKVLSIYSKCRSTFSLASPRARLGTRLVARSRRPHLKI